MNPRRLLLSWFCVSALLSLGFSGRLEARETYWERQLREKGRMNLPVTPLLQSRVTSCGEAAITMSFNYAYPEERVTEQQVIDYARGQGYYTERKFPYTSPADMLNIAAHYALTVTSGSVSTPEEGFALLRDTLTGGDPVIIDILVDLSKPTSGAHFVVVTGLELNPNPNKTRIYFNDPLTGGSRWAYWLGRGGVWNAWLENRDPGGAGWWMVISSP